MIFKKYSKIINIIFISILISNCGNNLIGPDKTTENKMYVYSNSGNTFYLIDYKTYEVVKEIQLPVSDTVSYDGMQISTNRDYLIFGTTGPFPDPLFGFTLYNTKEDKLENTFFLNLNGFGSAYFIAAQNKTEPGLIYTHFRDIGTYSIDLYKQKIQDFISDEHDFVLDKRIYNSPDGKWTVVKKNWEGDIYGGYTELEFYTKVSELHDLQFVLNKQNKDSLRIDDFEFLTNNKLFITYLPGPNRGESEQIGNYDLETKQLYRTTINFPGV